MGGGETLRGEAIELYPLPLALLELFLLRLPVLCTLVVRLMVFIRDVCAGEKCVPLPHTVLAAAVGVA
jgi:hypothetical protein